MAAASMMLPPTFTHQNILRGAIGIFVPNVDGMVDGSAPTATTLIVNHLTATGKHKTLRKEFSHQDIIATVIGAAVDHQVQTAARMYHTKIMKGIRQDTLLPTSTIQDAVLTGIEAVDHHTTNTLGMVITVTAAAVAGRRLGTTTSDPTQVLPTGPTDPHALPHRIPDTADTDDTMLPMAVLNVMAPRTVRVGVAILLHPQLLLRYRGSSPYWTPLMLVHRGYS
jgi:hypothetical protein